MSRQNAVEIAGFAVFLAGFAVMSYAFWLIVPVLMWFFVGALLSAAGVGLVWAVNGRPRP